MAVANNNFNDMWSGRLKATSKNISNVRVSLVLSYCFGDLSWLKGYTNGFLFDRTFVAVKCGHQPDLDALPENSTLMHLPNVGGNDHTMAYWMSEVLPTLPKAYDSDDAVLFLKDSMKSPWFIRDFKSLLEITLSDQAFGCVTEAPFPMSFYSNLKFLRMFYLEGYARSSNNNPSIAVLLTYCLSPSMTRLETGIKALALRYVAHTYLHAIAGCLW